LRGTEFDPFVASGLAGLRLADAANCAKTLLELVDAAFGIDELRESGEEGMGIGSDAGGNHGIFNTVDGFLFLGGSGGFRDETCARRHINEDDGIVFGMEILFHGSGWFAARTNARGGENGGNRSGVKFLMEILQCQSCVTSFRMAGCILYFASAT